MKMGSWVFLCTFLAITFICGGSNHGTDSGEDASSQTCLCVQGLCAVGWVQYMSACYKAEMQRITWKDAEMYCQSYNQDSHLASIHSMEENDFIFHLMRKPLDYKTGHAYWIGGHDTFKEGNFTWTDGSRFDFFSYPPSQPDGLEGENYLGSWFLSDGHITWNDFSNEWRFSFACKYSLKNSRCCSC